MVSVEKLSSLDRKKLEDDYTSTYYNVDTNVAAEFAAGCLLEVNYVFCCLLI